MYIWFIIFYFFYFLFITKYCHIIYNQYSDNYDIKLLITEKSIFFVRILNALSY